jgi:succinyl-CoA synthetase beta subunit
VYVADAKLNFDDNAEYRQTNIWKYQDTTEDDPREVEAAKVGPVVLVFVVVVLFVCFFF